MKSKIKLFIITGSTAIGKSSVAVTLAKLVRASVISADSMQIYRGMDIGTGKITVLEMQGVPHYMLDIVNPDANYNVDEYITDATAIIEKLASSNTNIIIVGGTGLYISALIQGFNLAKVAPNYKLRQDYQDLVNKNGNEYLHNELLKVDQISASKIAINDTKRVIRALEIFYSSGKTKHEIAAQSAQAIKDKYDICHVVLQQDREVLYKKIDSRVDDMIKNGLQEEVYNLRRYKNYQSLKAIGYSQFLDYFDNKYTLQECIDKIKQHSRNYAKRQITYFKNMLSPNKIFIDIKDSLILEKTVKEFFN